MINQLTLRNFKAHSLTDLKIGHLSLLCGENGIGKSSVLQALLLLKQAHIKNRLSHSLDLNKPLCYIGLAKDAIYQKAEEDLISITLIEDNKKFDWQFDASHHQSSFLKLTSPPISDNELNNSFLARQLHFLSASRLGSTEHYEHDDFAVEINKELSIDRGNAELTAHFLYHYQNQAVLTPLHHPSTIGDNKQNTLLAQVIAWEREISQGVNIHPEKVGNGYKIKYSFDKADGDRTEKFDASNVGFGLSYALPVLVAILSAEPGSLILIENPEAHLHPYAQAKLAGLMAIAAESGIQIIAETHSDHIINGTLVAVKNQQIQHENLKIYYFDHHPEQFYATQAIEVGVLPDGKITNQPSGFFDQIEKDMEIIMGF